LYAAVQDSNVHFHLLHAKDLVRLEQHFVDPRTGQTIDQAAVKSGYALGEGRFVVLTKQEVESVRCEPSREIALDGFLSDRALEPAWFERPYLLGPDGEPGEYYALARALAETQRQAIVHWVMRGRSYTGALRCDAGYLLLIALRGREEVVVAPKLAPRQARVATDQELQLARQLVAALAGDFEPEAFHSDYQAKLRRFVVEKAQGKRVRLVKPVQHKPRTGTLEQALRASVNHTRSREKKSAQG
jgi:DNA end-binding protein Ku